MIADEDDEPKGFGRFKKEGGRGRGSPGRKVSKEAREKREEDSEPMQGEQKEEKKEGKKKILTPEDVAKEFEKHFGNLEKEQKLKEKKSKEGGAKGDGQKGEQGKNGGSETPPPEGPKVPMFLNIIGGGLAIYLLSQVLFETIPESRNKEITAEVKGANEDVLRGHFAFGGCHLG